VSFVGLVGVADCADAACSSAFDAADEVAYKDAVGGVGVEGEDCAQDRYGRRALTVKEAKNLLSALTADRLESLFVLALATGLRRAELLGLRWSDIDLPDGVLFVRQTLQRTDRGLEFVPPKTHRSSVRSPCRGWRFGRWNSSGSVKRKNGSQPARSGRTWASSSPARSAARWSRATSTGGLSSYARQRGWSGYIFMTCSTRSRHPSSTRARSCAQ